MEYPVPRRYIRARRRPIGAGAFGGFYGNQSTPIGDARPGGSDPYGAPQPFPVTPVNVTAFSAGNRVKLFVQPIMFEWWNWRNPTNTWRGDIFVANPTQYRRVVHRRMSRVRRLDKLVPTRRVIYDPDTYGRQGKATGEVRVSQQIPGAALPSFDYRRR